MVISDEFKFPRPLDWSKFIDERKVKAVYGVSPIVPIKHVQRRWYQGSEEERPPLEEDNQIGLALQQLIDQVNASLQAHDVEIHLNLVRREEGYTLEIYDCTSLEVCRIIKAETVDLAELPLLLKNLQEGAGLLVDTET
jgi:hypothetical protein